jgi:hypothetical protein
MNALTMSRLALQTEGAATPIASPPKALTSPRLANYTLGDVITVCGALTGYHFPLLLMQRNGCPWDVHARLSIAADPHVEIKP